MMPGRGHDGKAATVPGRSLTKMPQGPDSGAMVGARGLEPRTR